MGRQALILEIFIITAVRPPVVIVAVRKQAETAKRLVSGI